MTADLLDSAESIRWISSIIKTWRKSSRNEPTHKDVKVSSHGKFSVTGTSGTVFMHGGKRAPTRISALPEGPNIGLTTGCSQIRTGNSVVSPRMWTHVKRNRTTLCFCIHYQLINKNGDHNDSQCPNYKTVRFGRNARLPIPLTYDRIPLTTNTASLLLDLLL